MATIVDLDKCTGCESCVEACPTEAIKIENEKAVIDQEECTDCEACAEECPEDALSSE